MGTDLQLSKPTARRGGRLLTGIAFGVAAAALIGWALTVVLVPPREPSTSAQFTLVESVQGEVGASVTLNTVAEWTPIPLASNLSSGTVTSVLATPGEVIKEGDVLYAVNLRPVVALVGDVPAFRTMTRGTNGADVAQLQRFLASRGLYKGAADGGFGWVTAAAVQAWQKSLGVVADGVVQLGDVVFVPDLPTRVSLDAEKVQRGATLAGGEPVILGLPVSPAMWIPITEAQTTLMPVGTRVEIATPTGAAWEAFVSDFHDGGEGDGLRAVLSAPEGATSICVDACEEIAVDQQTLLRTQIFTVESVQGVTVPVAALVTTSAGELVVVDESGVEHQVEVRATARGMAAVEGIDAGMRLRVPGDAG